MIIDKCCIRCNEEFSYYLDEDEDENVKVMCAFCSNELEYRRFFKFAVLITSGMVLLFTVVYESREPILAVVDSLEGAGRGFYESLPSFFQTLLQASLVGLLCLVLLVVLFLGVIS